MMKRLSIPTGKFTKRASLLRDKKQVCKSDLQATTREKKRRQAEDQRKHVEKQPFVTYKLFMDFLN